MSRFAILLPFLIGVLSAPLVVPAEALAFRVMPYLQNPAPDAMTVMWFSNSANPGTIDVFREEEPHRVLQSEPVRTLALDYQASEIPKLPSGIAPPIPYRHRVRVEGLQPDTRYHYEVIQDGESFQGEFRTAPEQFRSVRFIVYGDSETEPESTGLAVAWDDPTGTVPDRTYLVDQTTGYAENLKVIMARQPDFIAIAGDLVETGGEQRDWDEFWRHNAGPGRTASRIPLLPSPGNHEYFGGSAVGGYGMAGTDLAIRKYETYFDVPSNDAPSSRQRGRYYRIDYGPITFISLDCCNGLPANGPQDTNWYLGGETEGGSAPDFNPGSRQYEWLAGELKRAQDRAPFTFVMFHHAPYSVGPHGHIPGNGDNQSGTPVRALTPLFVQYGVDAVLCGHDEMFERSSVDGMETRRDGTQRPVTVQFYDVGLGGDGLRGPIAGLANPNQRFLAHRDAPEEYAADGSLLDGGKHYGHLEVTVTPAGAGHWKATLEPVYVFPLNKKQGDSLEVTGFERRVYGDVITLAAEFDQQREGVAVF